MNDSAVTNIDCGEILDISSIQDMYSRFRAAIEAEQAVMVDVSKIEHIDTAALQLLCVFNQEAQTKNIDIQWQQPSEILSNAVEMSGLGEYLAITE